MTLSEQARPMISVAVCTFNRAQSLGQTLETLIAQSGLDDVVWELLIIDNNSTDATSEVAKSFLDRLPARYFFEEKQGLSNARNRALLEFKGDVLIFTDDDVRLTHDWLKSYADAIEQFGDCGFFGGQVKPRWGKGKPAWLRDENMPLIGGLLVSYQKGDDNRRMKENDPLPFGASFGFRRVLSKSVGQFRPDLGVVGTSVERGDETNYLERALKDGFSGAYVGKAVCFHEVDYGRLKLSYLYRFGRDKGVSEARRATKPITGSYYNLVGYAIRGVGQFLRGRGDRFRQCVINMGLQRGMQIESKRISLKTE